MYLLSYNNNFIYNYLIENDMKNTPFIIAYLFNTSFIIAYFFNIYKEYFLSIF